MGRFAESVQAPKSPRAPLKYLGAPVLTSVNTSAAGAQGLCWWWRAASALPVDEEASVLRLDEHLAPLTAPDVAQRALGDL
jgi:hypothetical protein